MKTYSIIALLYKNGTAEAHVIDTETLFEDTVWEQYVDEYKAVYRIDVKDGEPQKPITVYAAE